MKRIIQMKVFKDGKYFVASGVDVAVVTQGKTWDELIKNIQEAVELFLEGEDLGELDIAPHPSILINYEVPTSVHA
jgi:predicted RNase H-like HicB family nuclease